MSSTTPKSTFAFAVLGAAVLFLSACSGNDGGSSNSSARSSSRSARSSVRSASSRSASSERSAATRSASSDSSVPFFSLRRSSASSAASQQSVSSQGQVIGGAASSAARSVGTATASVQLQVESDRTEVRAGDAVYYTVTVRNTSQATLDNFQVVYTFSPSQISILETDGVPSADHVLWTVSSLAPDQKRALRLRAQVVASLQHGDIIRGTAIATINGAVQPVSALSQVSVIQNLPMTGAGDNTGPLENTRRFLSPFRGSKGSSAIPMAVWTATILMGLGMGGALAKKYL